MMKLIEIACGIFAWAGFLTVAYFVLRGMWDIGNGKEDDFL